ncbi:hypothetical protein KL923_004237 [Ogataea haglerorum]|nr:hypothetical protein KL923_004237 [Ogataea haglerorum]KAG7757220.1 hypothetical protein KL947_003439 [Ogataea haglerorum]
MSADKRQFLISKTLARLLRHQALRDNLSIDEQGFVPFEQILNHRFIRSLKATPQEIFLVVNQNDKKRFRIVFQEGEELVDALEYRPNKTYYICALQGHSLSCVRQSYDMVELTPETFPDIIVHGTYTKNWKDIKQAGGLSRMNRNHIHFAKGLPRWLSNDPDNNVISGIRKSCDLLVYLDVDKVKNSPLTFYESGNGVILTPGDENGIVGLQYFMKVTDIKGNQLSI